MSARGGGAILRVARPAFGFWAVCATAAAGQPIVAHDGSPAAPPPAAAYLTWAPLDSLKATRERPLFLPLRREPAAPPPFLPMAPPAPPARSDETPHLTLLGIIRPSGTGGSAVVLDDTDHTSRSLRVGDDRNGWVVDSIEPDSVTLRKQQQTTTLTFPKTQPLRSIEE